MSNKQIGDALREMGVKIESHLIIDNFDGIRGDSRWSVCISKGKEQHVFDFYQYELKRYFSNGRPMGPHHVKRRGGISVEQLKTNRASKPYRPVWADVMFDAVRDAVSVWDRDVVMVSHETWADRDGRHYDDLKGQLLYDDCCAVLLALAGLGLDLDELNRLFEDY